MLEVAEEEAIVHGTHRKWSQQERGSRRGSGSLASFHHLLLIVPGCWVGFLFLPSLEELMSAAEAGSLRDMSPNPLLWQGHCRGRDMRPGLWAAAEPELPGRR